MIILLAVVGAGLAVSRSGVVKPTEVGKLLGNPANHNTMRIIFIGYPDKEFGAPLARRKVQARNRLFRAAVIFVVYPNIEKS